MLSQDARYPAVQMGMSHRSFVYAAAGFAALGGLLFGYDTGVISGAILFLKNDFAMSTFDLEMIVSGVLVGAALGSFVGGRLADLYGRRGLLFVTAVIFAAGAVICGAAPSVLVLIAGRIIVGLGIGLASGTVPVYISEVSSPEDRGWQVSLFQPTSPKSPRRKTAVGRSLCSNWPSQSGSCSPISSTTPWPRSEPGV
jgi:MFS family permease